jgi:hypothetical protein
MIAEVQFNRFKLTPCGINSRKDYKDFLLQQNDLLT